MVDDEVSSRPEDAMTPEEAEAKRKIALAVWWQAFAISGDLADSPVGLAYYEAERACHPYGWLGGKVIRS